MSTRRTRLIQTDIQISSDAVFVPKRSDLHRKKRTGVLNIACLTTHVYRRAVVASERIARLCDDQTTLAEKWKPKSGYHSYFLDSRGANSLPISHKFPTLIQPCILFYSEPSNPTWWGFGRCQKLVIIKKRVWRRQWRCEGRDSDMGAGCIFICQIKFLCYYIFFHSVTPL